MLAAFGLALSAASCGSSSTETSEPAGTYDLAVTEAAFPAKQFLGQESDLRLGVRNTGDKTVPGLTVTFTLAGQAGRDSALPFGVRDEQPGLAQAYRPVWVLEEHSPRLAGSPKPAGATTFNRKTFNFGPLRPGETTRAVWKLSAVKAGRFTILYRIGAGLGGEARAQTASGVVPGGSFVAEITTRTPETEVTDSGQIVVIKPRQNQRSASSR